MAKAAGKLTKLRSALKKMNSFGKLRRETSCNNSMPVPSDDCDVTNTTRMHTVYVGKSMRQYEVSSQLLDHPVIRELVERSDGCGETITMIACEVVLFEHLLWVLQNSDDQTEPLDDLVGFYAY